MTSPKKENLQRRLLEIQTEIKGSKDYIEQIRASDDYLASKERREMEIMLALEGLESIERELLEELGRLENSPGTDDNPPRQSVQDSSQSW